MPYPLEAHEPFGDGLRRIAKEQLESSVENLSAATDEGWDERIHDTRKRLKRLRALLRLARYSLGDERYRLENARYRDAARRIAGVRDAQVLVTTLESLREEVTDALKVSALKEPQALVQDHYEKTRSEHQQDAGAVEEAITLLRASLETLPDWSLENDWGNLREGLETLYRRGRRGFKSAYKSPSTESFHAWRKNVKYLWHALEILTPLWPAVLEVFAEEYHHLGELLGDDHDLAVLGGFLEANLHDPVTLGALEGQISEGRATLQRTAHPLGLRLYAETPHHFSRRLSRYARAQRETAPH